MKKETFVKCALDRINDWIIDFLCAYNILNLSNYMEIVI